MCAGLGTRHIVPLDEEALIAAAAETTGLSDYGDPGFREPLRILLEALEKEAKLTLTGRLLAAADILRILESRLRIIETENAHPEIVGEAIQQPIFVMGMGRTGTTILHELLAQDPGNRAPLTWEMMYPCPPLAPGEDHSSRLAQADAYFSLWDEIDPSYKTKHEGGGALTNECTYMMLHEFMADPFVGSHDILSYAMWLGQANVMPAYEMHKRILQVLQWRHDPKRRVLKAPCHLARLPELLSVYPDAKLIHTHRDPTKVVGSLTSLVASLRLMRSDEFNARSVTELMNLGQVLGLEKVIRERESGVVPKDQITDVYFGDFMQDPIAEVEKIYRHWEMDLSAEAKESMRAYMAAKPKAKQGAHEYAFSESVDVAKERRRYAKYMEYYEIPKEI
jgi:hypothetical protein